MEVSQLKPRSEIHLLPVWSVSRPYMVMSLLLLPRFIHILPSVPLSLPLSLYPHSRSAGPCCDSEPTVWDPPFDSEEGSAEPGAQPPASQDPAPRPRLQLPTVLEKNGVKVTHVTSPGSFYVQLVKNEPLLKWSVQRHHLCTRY